MSLSPHSQSTSQSPGAAQQLAERKAMAAMVFAALFFAVMGSFTKALTRGTGTQTALPAGMVALIRYLTGILFLLPLGVWRGVSLFGIDRKRLLMRGISGGIAATSYFFGIQYTSLTNATLLNYTSIIWGPLLAVSILKENLSRQHLLAIGVALLGVVIITHPDFQHTNIGDVIALISGIMAGTAVVQIRQLRKGESSLAIFFYFNLIGVPISLATLLLTHTHWVLPTSLQVLYLLGMSVMSVSAQLLMTYGFREMTAAQGGLINLTTIIYSSFCSVVFFHEPLTWQTACGGLLILTAAGSFQLFATYQTANARKEQQRESR